MKINLEYMIWVSFSLNPSFPPRSRLYEPEVTISTIPLFQLWAKWTNLGVKTRFAYFFHAWHETRACIHLRLSRSYEYLKANIECRISKEGIVSICINWKDSAQRFNPSKFDSAESFDPEFMTEGLTTEGSSQAAVRCSTREPEPLNLV